jgi:hypothetical protein
MCAACTSGSDAPNLQPVITPTPIMTQIFTGVVPVGGSLSNNFPVTAGGPVNVTLTAAGPPSNIVMGLALGTPLGSTCQPNPTATTSTAAGIIPQLSGTLGQGAYCVEIADIGQATGPVTFSITITHP